MVDLKAKEIPLTGKLITSEDPAIIGVNFQSLTNMRYTRTNPKGIGGHTKINTTALAYPKARSGIHFRKEQPSESHILVESYNADLTASEIYQNETAVPGAGDFSASVFTPSTDAGRGRFSHAPNGYIAYANGEETCIWGGDEAQIGGFINYDPSGAFFKDYTDQVTNTVESGSENVATLTRTTESVADDALLLHFDNNLTDSATTTTHTVTNVGSNVTFSTTSYAKKFGTHGAVFNGTNAYLTVPDHSEFDFSGGNFCIDAWILFDSFASNNVIYHQSSNVEVAAFTLGESEISAGDTITGKVSAKTAVVLSVDVTSGTWADGDAAGNVYAQTVSGAFQNEIVTVGGTDSATLAADFASNGANSLLLYTTTNGKLNLVITENYAATVSVVSIQSPVLTASRRYHIEVDEDGDNYYIFVDGDLVSVQNTTARATNYSEVVRIGNAAAFYHDGSIDELRVSTVTRHTSSFEVPAAAYGTRDATYMYVGSIMPLSGIGFYISTANNTAATSVVEYWNGSGWTQVTSFVDGTLSSGKTFAVDGVMTFASTADIAKVRSISGVLIYWYRVYSFDMDDSVGIYNITAQTPFQAIKDIWDGGVSSTLAFFKYNGVYNDFTTNVREDDYDEGNDATFFDAHGLTASQSLIVGFSATHTGIKFSILGGAENTTANTSMSVDYWDGSDWASVGKLQDGTSVDGISFSQSGLVTWGSVTPGSEFITEFSGSTRAALPALSTLSTTPLTSLSSASMYDIAVSLVDSPLGSYNSVQGSSEQPPSLYYYRVSFDTTLDGLNDVITLVKVTGVRAQKNISAYKFPLYAMSRLWLFSDQKKNKNSSICSAMDTTNVFNGEDSWELSWGNESEIVGAEWIYSQYGASVFSVLVVFKRNETWVLIGNSPDDWRQYKISSTVGCVAPETISVLELPTDTSNGVNRSSIIIFQGSNGIYMTDGRPPVLISQDIANLFDKRETVKINQDKVADSFAFDDVNNHEYHWCFAVGASVDSEWVLDYSRMQWFEIDRPLPLQAGIMVNDDDGSSYTYGVTDTGYMLRLENGNSFDGTAIAQSFQFGDIAIHGDSVSTETNAEFHSLVSVAKSTTENITVTHYGDSSTTGTELTMIPRKTGYRTVRTAEHQKLGSHILHSWKFSISTDDESCGFEPLFFTCLYKVSRTYIRDYRS